MKGFLEFFYRSIAAGIMIACAAAAYIQVGGVAGAALFSVGLIIIFIGKLSLYTGIVGYADTFSEGIFSFICLIGNIIGTGVIYFLIPEGSNIWTEKLTVNPLFLVARAVICGMLIYVCVYGYRTYRTLIPTLFIVPTFILIGAEHSIADSAYIWLAPFNPKTLWVLPLIAVGNALGAKLIREIIDLNFLANSHKNQDQDQDEN